MSSLHLKRTAESNAGNKAKPQKKKVKPLEAELGGAAENSTFYFCNRLSPKLDTVAYQEGPDFMPSVAVGSPLKNYWVTSQDGTHSCAVYAETDDELPGQIAAHLSALPKSGGASSKNIICSVTESGERTGSQNYGAVFKSIVAQWHSVHVRGRSIAFLNKTPFVRPGEQVSAAIALDALIQRSGGKDLPTDHVYVAQARKWALRDTQTAARNVVAPLQELSCWIDMAKDVFAAICEAYCGTNPTLSTSTWSCSTTSRLAMGTFTFELYHYNIDVCNFNYTYLGEDAGWSFKDAIDTKEREGRLGPEFDHLKDFLCSVMRSKKDPLLTLVEIEKRDAHSRSTADTWTKLAVLCNQLAYKLTRDSVWTEDYTVMWNLFTKRIEAQFPLCASVARFNYGANHSIYAQPYVTDNNTLYFCMRGSAVLGLPNALNLQQCTSIDICIPQVHETKTYTASSYTRYYADSSPKFLISDASDTMATFPTPPVVAPLYPLMVPTCSATSILALITGRMVRFQ